MRFFTTLIAVLAITTALAPQTAAQTTDQFGVPIMTTDSFAIGSPWLTDQIRDDFRVSATELRDAGALRLVACADPIGSPTRNAELAQNRAAHAINFLADSLGINGDIISPDPRTSCTTRQIRVLRVPQYATVLELRGTQDSLRTVYRYTLNLARSRGDDFATGVLAGNEVVVSSDGMSGDESFGYKVLTWTPFGLHWAFWLMGIVALIGIGIWVTTRGRQKARAKAHRVVNPTPADDDLGVGIAKPTSPRPSLSDENLQRFAFQLTEAKAAGDEFTEENLPPSVTFDDQEVRTGLINLIDAGILQYDPTTEKYEMLIDGSQVEHKLNTWITNGRRRDFSTVKPVQLI